MRSAGIVLSLLMVLLPGRGLAQEVPEVPEIPTLPRDPAVMNYRLSTEKIRRIVDAQRGLDALGAKDPELVRRVNGESEALFESKQRIPQAAESAALLDRHPRIRAVLDRAGITSLDYSAGMAALGTAVMAFEIKQGRLNPAAAPPPETAAEKANVALLEKNETEWTKMWKELEQLLESSPWAQE